MGLKKKYQIKKLYIMKKTEKNFYKNKTIDLYIYIYYEELLRSYAELEIRLKTMEEHFKINDSESN